MARAQIGVVKIWGDIPENQTPDSTKHIMVSAGGTVATGGGHTLGIISGTRRLSGWGKNSWCQLGFCPTSPGPETPRINPPDDLDEFPLLSVSAGLLHSLAIRDGGTAVKYKVIGWGQNSNGKAEVPTGLKAKVVSAGETTSAAIDLDGNLVVWGLLSDPDSEGLKFLTVSMGNTFGIALKTDGTLFAWGSDAYGQPVYKANVVHADEVFVSVYAGDSHWIAIRRTGEVICEGFNVQGQNSVPSGTYHSVSTGDWHASPGAPR